MSRPPFVVLVATDGSAPARAAVRLAARFPWPPDSRAAGLVAESYSAVASAEAAPVVFEALEQEATRVAEATRRLLATRWPRAEVEVVGGSAVASILATARRRQAGVIVMGSRGHGPLSRLVLGSVSRGVARRATGPVLIAKGRPRPVRHLLLGIDGSPHAHRAVEMVARLTAPAGGRVTLVAVVEPVRVPSSGLLPAAVRARLQVEAAAAERSRLTAARQHLGAAQAVLGRAGWRTGVEVRVGAPLDQLLACLGSTRAETLVVGARGVGGLSRLLLGSVAEGAMGQSPVPVLVVR